VKFKEGKYVGDPLNAVRIFNEKEVDELIVVDIDATVKGADPNYTLIEKMAKECRMPLCYGGGIKTVEQAQRIFSLGVEKIAISSVAIQNPEVISELAAQVGNQSVVVVMDVHRRKFTGRYELYINNGTKATGIDPVTFAKKVQQLGAGEIVLNSIDQDGVMSGYDMTLIDKVKSVVNIPMTVLGGAGSWNDIGSVIQKHGIIGVAAGSLFVFKGKYKAVLINYPNAKEKEELIGKYFK
jgi:cyclase